MVVVVEVGSEGGRPGESPPHALLIRLDFCQRCAGDSSPRDIVMFHSFGMSIDGHGAGPTQSLENPLGVGGLALHEWVFKTRTFHATVGKDGGETGVDDDSRAASTTSERVQGFGWGLAIRPPAIEMRIESSVVRIQ